MVGLIVDTDAGCDDAIALCMLLTQNIKIIGITCVGGNVPLNKVVLNVLACLRHTNRSDVKVYPGSSSPILASNTEASFWHGDDGLGDALTTEERDLDSKFSDSFNIVQTNSVGNSAVEFLINTLMNHPVGTVDILSLGPLTNLALALKIEPKIASRVGRIVSMGGSFKGRGNITRTAEFNIFGDPEAASICLDSERGGFPNMEFVDLEATYAYAPPLSVWNSLFESGSTSFLARLAKGVSKKSENIFGNFPLPDPLTAFVYLSPDSITSSVNKKIEVELGKGACRGMTIVDWSSHELQLTKMTRFPHKIIQEIDNIKFLEYLSIAAKVE